MIINIVNSTVYLLVFSLFLHALSRMKFRSKNILLISIFAFLFLAQFVIGKKTGAYSNFTWLILFPLYILLLVFKSKWKVWMSVLYAIMSVAILVMFNSP
jgi:hypothetical protein